MTQACSYCTKAGKRCNFEVPPSRTSLTRKNLEAAEHRCKQLEALLRSLKPEIDLETALKEHSENSDPSELPIELKSQEHRSSVSSDEYEWHEASLSSTAGTNKDEEIVRDGMANMPAELSKSGYLGIQSSPQLFN
jgi:transcriptional regulatory protein GAL4